MTVTESDEHRAIRAHARAALLELSAEAQGHEERAHALLAELRELGATGELAELVDAWAAFFGDVKLAASLLGTCDLGVTRLDTVTGGRS